MIDVNDVPPVDYRPPSVGTRSRPPSVTFSHEQPTRYVRSKRAQTRSATRVRHSANLQRPELSFLQSDLERAKKYGDLCVDIFNMPRSLVPEKPMDYSELLIAANASRSKSKFKSIFVPHGDDVAKGTFDKHHILKGSGDTFFSVVARHHRQREIQREEVRSKIPDYTKITTHDPLKLQKADKQKSDSEKKKKDLEKYSKRKRKNLMGGFKMNIVPDREGKTLYEVGDQEEKRQITPDIPSDPTSDDEPVVGEALAEDKITDFTQLIELIHSKGSGAITHHKYNVEEDISQGKLQKYSGTKTVHLNEPTAHQKDGTKKVAKSISLGYLKRTFYNIQLMTKDSVRTEKLRNRPRRVKVQNIESKLRLLREENHSTTYYNGREWLREQEEEEKRLFGAVSSGR